MRGGVTMAVGGAGRGRSARGRGPRRCLAILALAVALAAGCSSNSTEPADPDPPVVRLPDLTVAPDSALYCVEVGIETESQQLYMHGVAETTVVLDADFHATFDPLDTLTYSLWGGVAPADWASHEERRFFPILMSYWPTNYAVYFLPDTARSDQRGADEAILYRRYRVWGDSVAVAAGLADLTFRRVGANREWKLVRWEDRRDTATVIYTYGMRRLAYYTDLQAAPAPGPLP